MNRVWTILEDNLDEATIFPQVKDMEEVGFSKASAIAFINHYSGSRRALLKFGCISVLKGALVLSTFWCL